MATGRSDYPNQINNVLALPGRLPRRARRARERDQRGDEARRRARDRRRHRADDELHAEYIIPSVFNPRVARGGRRGVADAAVRAGRGAAAPRHQRQVRSSDSASSAARRGDRAQARRVDAGEVGELDDGVDERGELERLAGLEVLQRRGLVLADALGAGQPPLDRDRRAGRRPRGRSRASRPSSTRRAAASARGGTCRPASTRVSALSGLNATLPISLTQISSRTCSSTGHFSPPAIIASLKRQAARRTSCRPARRS